MMKLKIVEGPLSVGKAYYFEDIFTLEYKIGNKLTTTSYLLIYDTLTVVFDKYDKKMESFDSYTNKELWEIKPIKIPEFYKIGSLIIEEGFEDDTRYAYKWEPIYEYSPEGVLKILLQKETNDDIDYYLISKDLMVGINNQTLSSFILLNITMC